MLDLFTASLPAGFPDHPHRGFETVTYLQEGAFCHEDFKGHKGMLESGDVQWMTAGKGNRLKRHCPFRNAMLFR